MNWASKVDLVTGRPVETEHGNYDDEDRLILPGPTGGHNWHPMSYDPGTGLVFIPALDAAWWYTNQKDFEYRPAEWNLANDLDQTSSRGGLDRIRQALQRDEPRCRDQLRRDAPGAGRPCLDPRDHLAIPAARVLLRLLGRLDGRCPAPAADLVPRGAEDRSLTPDELDQVNPDPRLARRAARGPRGASAAGTPGPAGRTVTGGARLSCVPRDAVLRRPRRCKH